MPLVCSICADGYPYASPCDLAHPDVCHGCYQQNLHGGYDTFEHTPPRETPTPLVLSPREVAALVRYRIHRQAVTGTGPLVELVTEDPAP